MKRLWFIVAVACGVAAFVMVRLHVNDEVQQRLKAYGQVQTVFVASRDIDVRERLTSADYAVEQVPKKFVQPDAIEEEGQLRNAIVTTPIPQGAQILGSKLDFGEGRQLSYQISGDPDMRAISLLCGSDSCLGGMIEPGDLVDVIGVFEVETGSDQVVNQSRVLLEACRVLAMGKRLSSRSIYRAAGTATIEEDDESLVTVEVDAEQAQMLALVSRLGDLRCVLRGVENNTKHQYVKPWVRSDDDEIKAKGKIVVADKDYMFEEPMVH